MMRWKGKKDFSKAGKAGKMNFTGGFIGEIVNLDGQGNVVFVSAIQNKHLPNKWRALVFWCVLGFGGLKLMSRNWRLIPRYVAVMVNT